MSVASCKISLLQNTNFSANFDEIAPDTDLEDLTSDHIEHNIRSIVQKDATVDSHDIENCSRGIRVPVHIEDPEARIPEYFNYIFKSLEEVGYSTFLKVKEQNPKTTVKLIQSKLHLEPLEKNMAPHLEYREGHKKRGKGKLS